MIIGLHKNCIRDHWSARTRREMDFIFLLQYTNETVLTYCWERDMLIAEYLLPTQFYDEMQTE